MLSLSFTGRHVKAYICVVGTGVFYTSSVLLGTQTVKNLITYGIHALSHLFSHR